MFTPCLLHSFNIFAFLHLQTLDITEIQDVELLTVALKEFLQSLYFKYLAVNPKDRRVVIVETIFSSNRFRQRLVDVLFNHLDVCIKGRALP